MKFVPSDIRMRAVFMNILAIVTLAWSSTLQAQTAPTDIQVTSTVLQSSVHRFGVNLGDNGYWDSGQLMKNLVFENPGFEGLRYRVIFRCAAVSANTCMDDNQYNGQPAGYWNGASYLVLSGTAAGTTGTIVSNTASSTCKSCGPTLTFDKNVNLAVGDYFSAVTYFPGAGDAGWADDTSGGGTITTETTDISPNSPGKQAILLSASASGQYAKVTQGFDTWSGLSFIQLNGNFAVTFRAKGVGGSNQLNVSALRLQPSVPNWLNQTITLTNSWQDYTLTFTANETGAGLGPVQLNFLAQGSSVELDDVSLQQTNSDPTNTTVFRDDVVNALKSLNPGTIRMMAAGAALGSDLPNQLQLPFARYRMGFNADGSSYPNIAYGIHEFLQLCQAVGADPWITIPTATTPAEMTDFIQYLTGTGADSWSSLRISRGQTQPWTSVFNKIHIELGNETWNGSFKGESMNYPAYPQWANQVFGAARKTSGFVAGKFDLVLSGLAATPGYNAPMLSYSTQHDSFDVAPYLLFSANDESQALQFGALFAEPEIFDSAGGEIYKNMAVGAAAPSATSSSTAVSVYETNLGTMIGNITKPELDKLTPSIGAGIAHTDHMLQMMRIGMQYQNAFSLPQYEYRRGDGSLTRLWGLVVDMGTTNRRRPQFWTQSMANAVIGGSMLQTAHTGTNPTWNQPLSSDGVVLNGAHELQSFAFVNNGVVSVIVFNLSQNDTLPVTFSGPNAPSGSVTMTQITSANITDNNEFSNLVLPNTQTLSGFNPATGLSLPPFSMTVLSVASSAVQAPSFSVAGGTYTTPQTLTITDNTPGATVYYTTDGSTPTTSSPRYAAPILIDSTMTVQAIATAPAKATAATSLQPSAVTSATYVISLPAATAPTFSVAAGLYATAQTVSIADTTAGAKIYYTTDGTVPTTSSAVYTSPIKVSATETVKAIAAAKGHVNSPVASATYTINHAVSKPAFSVAAGTYASAFTVSITDATSGAAIHYTTDGSTPTASSAKYKAPIKVSATETINAIAVAKNYANSPVASATYSIVPVSGGTKVAAPTFSVPAGTYSTTQSVSLADTTAGAVIHFTVDGTTPTTNSTRYKSPVQVSATETIKAIATLPSSGSSAVASAAYTITPVSSGGTGTITAGEMVLYGSAKLKGSTLQLTDGGAAEIATAWYGKKVGVGSFIADFTFQAPSSTGDGFTFTLQNDPKKTWASGGNGGALGYAGIKKSVAIKFGLYNGLTSKEVSATGIFKNGASPTTQWIDMSGAISLHAGHVMHAVLTYNGTQLKETITDTVTNAVFTESYSIDIPSVLGSTTGYIGFTASTGGKTAVQNILSLSYTGATAAQLKKK